MVSCSSKTQLKLRQQANGISRVLCEPNLYVDEVIETSTHLIERLFHGAQIARSCWRSEVLFSFLLACCSYCRASEGISCLLLLPLLPPRTNQPLSTPITQFGYLPPEAEMQRTRSICSPASHLTMSSYQGLVDKTLLP